MYGIIAAMQEEMKEIKKIMQNIENKEIYELNFFKGTISDKNVVLVEAGVGKVNAARVTQILIDNFKVEGIINVGSAGSCNDELEIGDIVIGKKLVQHDFDITAFGHEKGFISNVGQYVESDEQLIVKIEKIDSKYVITTLFHNKIVSDVLDENYIKIATEHNYHNNNRSDSLGSSSDNVCLHPAGSERICMFQWIHHPSSDISMHVHFC